MFIKEAKLILALSREGMGLAAESAVRKLDLSFENYLRMRWYYLGQIFFVTVLIEIISGTLFIHFDFF